MTAIVETNNELSQYLDAERSAGKKIGFVPTMGALHEGHLSLIRMAKRQNDIVVVSIFINPTQFNDPEDYRNYPRTREADKAYLEAEGVAIAFMPDENEMYPEGKGYLTDFDAGYVANVLEGEFRPGHFDGVATIVKKLLDAVEPHRAYFGQKDYQQLLVIRQLVKTYDLPVEIVSGPIVRESDGLALSSRNILLTAKERSIVPAIYQTLLYYKAALEKKFKPETYQAEGLAYLKSYPDFNVEYFTIRNAYTLEEVNANDRPKAVVLLVALSIGKVRLIDNMVAYPYS